MILTREPEINLLALEQMGETYEPTSGEVFSAAISEGFRMTSLVAARDIYRLSPLGRGEGVEDFFRLSPAPERDAKEERPLDEEEWKDSPYFRPKLKHFDGMTEFQAKILAERYDEKKEHDWIFRKAEGKTLSLIGGMLVGGIPDPLNFIPFLASWKAASWAGRIGRASGEAAIGAALTEPFLHAQADVFGEDYDLKMTAQNIGAAIFIGAGFGALGKTLSSLSESRRALATHKAADDLINERPVNVGPILGDEVDGTVRPVREPLEPPEPPPSTSAKEGLEAPTPEEIADLDARVKEVEAEGRLDDADKAELAAADEAVANTEKLAEANKAAAFCLTG